MNPHESLIMGKQLQHMQQPYGYEVLSLFARHTPKMNAHGAGGLSRNVSFLQHRNIFLHYNVHQ